MQDKIAKFIAKNTPIDEAFLKLSQELNPDNNESKALLKELIRQYTQQERENLELASNALDNARFAFNKAENELDIGLNEQIKSLKNSKINDVCKEYLNELIFSELGCLHHLSQNCESAFINLLEEGVLVRERAHALANYYLIISCKQLQPERILHSAKLILSQAIELANLWQSYASELLGGCISGLYEALELICERAIKEMKFGCSEPEAKELLDLEENFANVISGLISNDYGGQILGEIYRNELASISAKFSRAMGRSKHILGLKLSGLSSDAKRSAAQLQFDAREAAAKFFARLKK